MGVPCGTAALQKAYYLKADVNMAPAVSSTIAVTSSLLALLRRLKHAEPITQPADASAHSVDCSDRASRLT